MCILGWGIFILIICPAWQTEDDKHCWHCWCGTQASKCNFRCENQTQPYTMNSSFMVSPLLTQNVQNVDNQDMKEGKINWWVLAAVVCSLSAVWEQIYDKGSDVSGGEAGVDTVFWLCLGDCVNTQSECYHSQIWGPLLKDTIIQQWVPLSFTVWMFRQALWATDKLPVLNVPPQWLVINCCVFLWENNLAEVAA